MNRLFLTLGIDYVQWRALLRAYVLTDLGAVLGAYGPVEQRRAIRQMLLLWVFLPYAGFGPAVVILLSREVLFGTMLLASSVMLMTGIFAFGLAASLIAPEDLAIVGFRPVDSRTYFAARASGLVLQTLEVGVLTGAPSVLALLVRGGLAGAWSGAASVVLAALTLDLAIVLLYGWLLRVLAPATLSRVTAYVGVIGLFLLLAIYMIGFAQLTDHMMGDDGSFDVSVSARTWTILWPPVWFASIAAAGLGETNPFTMTGMMLAVLAPLALGFVVRGRVARDYADRVTEMASEPSPNPAPARRTLKWLTGERRAIALLVMAQLRGDIAFQSGVVMNLFIAGLLLGVAGMSEMPQDPFFRTDRVLPQTMFYMALIILGMSAYQSIARTAEHQASWIFFTTPSDKVRQVRAARDAVLVLLVLPPFLLLILFLAYAYGHVGHALLHGVFLGGMTYLVFDLAVALRPSLPFSVPATNRKGMFGGVATIVAVMIGLAASTLLEVFAFTTMWGVMAGLLSLAVSVLIVRRAARGRMARQLEAVTYLG